MMKLKTTLILLVLVLAIYLAGTSAVEEENLRRLRQKSTSTRAVFDTSTIRDRTTTALLSECNDSIHGNEVHSEESQMLLPSTDKFRNYHDCHPIISPTTNTNTNTDDDLSIEMEIFERFLLYESFSMSPIQPAVPTPISITPPTSPPHVVVNPPNTAPTKIHTYAPIDPYAPPHVVVAPTPTIPTPPSVIVAPTPTIPTPPSVIVAPTPTIPTPPSVIVAPTPTIPTPPSVIVAPTPTIFTPPSVVVAPSLSPMTLIIIPTLPPIMQPTTLAPVKEQPRPTIFEEARFCWKNSFGRGVGTIPDQCPSDRDTIGLLCYSKCPAGFARFGFDCHQLCPPEFSDQGLFCRLTEYGRGFGYIESGRCNEENSGGCEQCLLLLYPKCAPGFSPFGCNICRPNTPDCGALGFAGQFDLSCTKNIIIGDPTPRLCSSDKVYDAGLCYTPCPEKYTGIGPVCWGQGPMGWVNCGLGASPDSGSCARIIVDQVLGVGEAVAFVASLGSSAIVKASTSAAKAVEIYRDLQKKLPEIFERFDDAKKAWEAYSTFTTVGEFVESDPDTMDPIEVVRTITSLSAIFDPTGVSSIIAAYTFTTCDKTEP